MAALSLPVKSPRAGHLQASPCTKVAGAAHHVCRPSAATARSTVIDFAKAAADPMAPWPTRLTWPAPG